MSLPRFGVRNPVVANLVMFAILGAGLIFGARLTREFFPEVRPNQVVVAAPYPGAAPDEVESALAIKIEDALAEIDRVKEMRTVVTEGSASVTVEFEPGVDIEFAVAEVQRQVDSLQDLPEDAERIVVRKLEPNIPAIVLSLYGDADEREMKRAIRRIYDDLDLLEGMGDLVIGGVRADEVTVEVRPEALIEHGLSMPEVSRLIGEAMRELPGGTVRSDVQNVGVRTVAAGRRGAEVARIPVKSEPGGRVIRIGDIADIREGFVDIDRRARLNGKPAVSITVFKVGDDDAVNIAELVKAYVAGLRGDELTLNIREKIASLTRRPGDERPLSERVRAYEMGLSRAATTPLPGEVMFTTDLARFIVDRLDLLLRNAFYGGCLVFLTLLVLLSWRTSFWVALGLIISMAGTLATMYFVGVTLNLLTMFGLIVVIGLLVDDAIVVAENITARHERGESAEVAAIRGTGQVLWPVVATVLTTICAFLPLALIQGRLGDLLESLPYVVAIALLVSLIEGLFILPSHMAHSLRGTDRRRERGAESRLEKAEHWFDQKRDAILMGKVVPAYVRLLKRLLRHRYLTLVCAVAVMIACAGIVAGGRLEFIFFEDSDAETVNGSLVMPVGTPAERTDAVLKRLEAATLAQPEVQSVYVVVGSQGDLEGESVSVNQPNVGQLIIELVPVERRDRASPEIRESIIAEAGELTGVKSFRLEEIGGGPGGPALNYAVTGTDERQIARAVERVKAELRRFDGVYGIADDADAGAPELRVERLRAAGEALGLTRVFVGQQVRAMVLGLEAFTFAGDREDVKVRVIAPERVRRSLSEIERSFIFTPDGEPVALAEVAEIIEGESYASVRRLNRRRAVTVTADVARTIANADEIAAALEPVLRSIERDEPGITILKRGRQEDVADSFRTLPLGMAVACGLIYIILAWLFGSFVQPLIVMAAIPFATIGMILGHLLMGFPLTFLSLIGFVALTGVVVNDSLILMEFFNEKRREGKSVYDACVEAGRARFRAILLTTVTTVLGLSPLMLEQSFQARFLIPMAITIAFGLLSATVIILVVLPCMLMIFQDFRRATSAVWHGQWPPPIDQREAERQAVLRELAGMDEEDRAAAAFGRRVRDPDEP